MIFEVFVFARRRTVQPPVVAVVQRMPRPLTATSCWLEVGGFYVAVRGPFGRRLEVDALAAHLRQEAEAWLARVEAVGPATEPDSPLQSAAEPTVPEPSTAVWLHRPPPRPPAAAVAAAPVAPPPPPPARPLAAWTPEPPPRAGASATPAPGPSAAPRPAPACPVLTHVPVATTWPEPAALAAADVVPVVGQRPVLHRLHGCGRVPEERLLRATTLGLLWGAFARGEGPAPSAASVHPPAPWQRARYWVVLRGNEGGPAADATTLHDHQHDSRVGWGPRVEAVWETSDPFADEAIFAGFPSLAECRAYVEAAGRRWDEARDFTGGCGGRA